jgi:hypothetical protein
MSKFRIWDSFDFGFRISDWTEHRAKGMVQPLARGANAPEEGHSVERGIDYPTIMFCAMRFALCLEP